MSRRVSLTFALLGFALLIAAVAPWTLSPGGYAAAVARHLSHDYGLGFQVRGRSTIVLLPMPRVKFQDVTVRSSAGMVVAEGGTLRGQLELLPLLLGRAQLSEVSLTDSRITVAAAPSDLADSGLAEFLRAHGPEQAKELPQVRRVRLVNSSIHFASGPPVEKATLTVDWPQADEPLQGSGAFTWNGEAVEVTRISLDPHAIVTGKLSPFLAAVDAPSIRLTILGEIQPGAIPRVTGHSTMEARSVRDLSRWTGVALPLGSLVQAASIEGDFTADRNRISWPSALVTFGADQLEGTLGIRFDSDRPVVTGTLAAERLNLSDFLVPLAQVRTTSGLWSGEEVSLQHTAGGDLDLRVSANDAWIGGVKLGEMAANVMVRPGRIEASVGRASLNGGTVKGRIAFAALEVGMDLKLQGTFSGVDVGSFLNDARRQRWITGAAHGQFTLEGSGATPADIVRQSHGRTTLSVKQGELVGVGLNDVLLRLEKHPLLAFLDRRSGRTPFDEAHIHLNIGAGLAEITEGSLTAPKLKAALKGRVSFIDRDVAIRAHVEALPAEPKAESSVVIDVLGSWDDISVVPDARSLIERSGAAKPLFGRERIPGAASRGTAAAPVAQ